MATYILVISKSLFQSFDLDPAVQIFHSLVPKKILFTQKQDQS
jgi:hypothetical protein